MENNEKRKFKFEKRKVYLMIIVIMLLGTIGFSLAFYAVSITNDANVEVEITIEEKENATLTYTISDSATIHINENNFYEGAGNIVNETTGTVTLVSDDAYTTGYVASFYIEGNTFEYVTADETSEILLIVTTPDGTVYTGDIDGLEYETVTVDGETYKGYDITSANGLFVIADKYYISTTVGSLETVQEWSAEVVYLNLDEDQTANQGNSMVCYFSFGDEIIDPDSLTIKGTLLAAYGGASVIELLEDPSYSTIATASDSGIYATTDINGGTTYYYRGEVDDNWVYFAGYYWRIIRIDEDGNIKLIYAGETVVEEDSLDGGITLTSTNSSENTQQIGTSKFNSSYTKYYYVGYVYSTDTSTLHGTSNDSTIKGALDSWYTTNIVNEGYDDYLAETNYCIDREAWSSYSTVDESTYVSSYSSGYAYYGAYVRLSSSSGLYSPSLECNSIEADTLSLKVGLISADEVSLAGGVSGTANSTYYLYTGSSYWTLSPFSFSSDYAYVFSVFATGSLNANFAFNAVGVRPAVSLTSSTLILEGSGTYLDPYIVSEADQD